MSNMLDGTSYTYLTALAVADTVTLAISFPIGFSRCNHCYTPDTSGYLRRVYEVFIFLPFNNMTTTMSVWITTALAIERYVFVYHPIKAKRYCKVMFARQSIFLIGISSVFLNISYFFTHEINDCNHVTTSVFGESTANTAIAWIQALLVNFIPSILLTTVSIILLYGLSSANLQQNVHCVHSYQEDIQFRKMQNKFTATLVAIIVLFLLGHVPIAFAFTGIARNVFNSHVTYKRFRLAANLLQFVTFSSNFFVYCALDGRFMMALRKMYCNRCSRLCSQKCPCRKVKLKAAQVTPDDSSTEL